MYTSEHPNRTYVPWPVEATRIVADVTNSRPMRPIGAVLLPAFVAGLFAALAPGQAMDRAVGRAGAACSAPERS